MMPIPGVPAEGYQTVGQIVGTNDIRFRLGQDCMTIASELLSAHTTGAPVVDEENQFLGFISEIDLLRALGRGQELSQLRAEDVMTPIPVAVEATTPIGEAVRIMDECHLLNLPVSTDGQVRYSISRHDILRAWTGLGLSREISTT